MKDFVVNELSKVNEQLIVLCVSQDVDQIDAAYKWICWHAARIRDYRRLKLTDKDPMVAVAD